MSYTNLPKEAIKEIDDIADKFNDYVADFLLMNIKSVSHVTGICAVLNYYMAQLYVNAYEDHSQEEYVNLVTQAYKLAKKFQTAETE